MDKNDVTKRGRRRKYKSDAERQRAYRQRQTTEEAERNKKFRRRVFIDPNKVMDTITLDAEYSFRDMGSFFRDQHNWKKELDRARFPEWIAILLETRRNLNRFMRILKKL
jgi:hypothetical protein